MSTEGQTAIDFQPEGQGPANSPGRAAAAKPARGGQIDFREETVPPPVAATPKAEPSTTDKLISGAGNVVKGAGKGLLNTVSGVSELLNKVPYVGETLAPREGVDAMHAAAKPEGTAQKIGYYGEQGAEFLVPGGLEKGAGEQAALHMPQIGRLAAPLGRTAMAALDSGVINKMQGGSFKGGAEAGAASGTVGEAARAVAPSIAESALGVTRRLRGYGRTPGAAALEEVSGVTPGKVMEQAGDKLRSLTQELESRAADSTTQASTKPALDVIDKAQIKAIQQNNPVQYDLLHKLREQLTKEFSTGDPIPRNVSAKQILDLKRGIGSSISTWTPELRKGITPTMREVYGALDGELDRTVPGAADLNQRISSLIPVKDRARATEEGAGVGQKIAHRVMAHTGALAGAGIGAGVSSHYGKSPALGAVAGLAMPELIASPTVQMFAARTLNSPIMPRVARGATIQAIRALGQNQEEDERNPGE